MSVEETVPYDLWLSWLKNLAIDCIHHFHLANRDGYKHTAKDMWTVIILSALLALSFNEAADQLNEILWEELLRHKRNKKGPKQYQGIYVRNLN